MLVFPQWSPQVAEGCRVQHWAPPQRFSHYVARPVPIHPPQQISDEESTGGSSPERAEVSEDISVCEWRGCGARCAGVARLSAHVARAHALPHRDGLFYCAWRGCARPQRGFNARYKMLVHVRTHTNERPHTCNQCNKSFSRAENLKIHLRSHSGEKPYVCPYEGCGKAYSNSSDRFKHTRTHTVDKPYCCKVPGCNKRYTDPSSLRKHVKTYKHFVPKDLPRPDQGSSDEALSPAMSPEYTEPTYHESTSPLRIATHIAYSPPRGPVSPNYTETIPRIPQPVYATMDKLYLRPEQMYPMRIPAYEMSHMEYTQMYEHAYRSYYEPRLNYPVLSPSVTDKAYGAEAEPAAVELQRYSPVATEQAPLNLKCARLECRPIEDLVRRTDLPLDLSTKS